MLRLLAFAGFTVLMPCGLFLADASAQVKTDGSTGPRVSLTGPNYTIGQNLGTLSGKNLFQSFSTFNLVKGDVATFTGSSTLSNIIARVTGDSASSINGTIATQTGGTPSLFLLNPAGIMFGPHASLNVEGSFHASTAGQVQFADGAKFVANLGGGSTFTTAAPTAFGFLAANPAPVSVTGSTLGVRYGEKLSLVGGGVQIAGATLSAPAGVMTITSVGAPTVVPLNPVAGPPPATAPSGPVQISEGDVIIASSSLSASNGSAGLGGPGGLVLVTANGNVSLSGGSSIASIATGPGASGAISVTAGGSLQLLNGSNIATGTIGPGWAGNVFISAAQILLDDGNTGLGTFIESTSAGSGAGEPGSVTVTSPGALTVNAGGAAGSAYIFRGLYSLTGSGSLGVNAGAVTLNGEGSSRPNGIFGNGSNGSGNNIFVNVAGELQLLGGGKISTQTGLGNSGSIAVDSGSIIINDENTGIGTGIVTDVNDTMLGAESGEVNINAGGIVVNSFGAITLNAGGASGSAYIASSVSPYEVNLAIPGNISIKAASFTVNGNDSGASNGILATGESLPFGGILPPVPPGSVSLVILGDLQLLNAQILTTSPVGISIATASLSVKGGAIDVGDGFSPSFPVSDPLAIAVPGSVVIQGGNVYSSEGISVHAGSLLLDEGGVISDVFPKASETQSKGQISIIVTGALTMLGTTIVSQSGAAGDLTPNSGGIIDINAHSLTASHAAIQAENDPLITFFHIVPFEYYDSTSSAAGGQIKISLNGKMDLLDGTIISTNTYDAGSSGSITIADNAGTIDISGGSRISSSASLDSSCSPYCSNYYDASAPPEITGAAGPITILAAGLNLSDGQISTSTVGTGAGGSITLGIEHSAFLDNSQISTQSAAGGGGGIRVAIGDLLFIENSLITSQVQGGSLNAGDTTVTAQNLVLDSSQMSANAFGGRGGNINVDVGGLLSTPDSAITASSAKGVSGIIAIDSQFSDVSASLADLSGKLAIANQLSHLACTGGFSTESSLVLKGRGSLPADGDTPLDLSYNSVAKPTTPMLLPDQSTNRIRSPQRFIPCNVGPNPKAGSAAGYHAWWMTTLNRHLKNTSPNQKLRRAA